MCKLSITEKKLKEAGFKTGDKVEIEITKDALLICKSSPNYLKMLAKNPQLANLKKSLNLLEIL